MYSRFIFSLVLYYFCAWQTSEETSFFILNTTRILSLTKKKKTTPREYERIQIEFPIYFFFKEFFILKFH